MRLLLKADSRSVNTHARSEGIRVRELVPHHDHLILCHDKFPERLRLDTRLHAGILRGLLLLSTEISNAVAVLDDSLVAAAGEGKVDRHAGILVTERIGRSIQSEADTQRR